VHKHAFAEKSGRTLSPKVEFNAIVTRIIKFLTYFDMFSLGIYSCIGIAILQSS